MSIVLRVDLATGRSTVSEHDGPDDLVLTGRAPRHSYLLVHPTVAYVLDADDLPVDDVAEVLLARHGRDARVVAVEHCVAVVLVGGAQSLYCRG